VNECLRELNGAEDYPADTARLHGLLERQAYRLAHWRVAADEINYRRFFDINDLAALRMENQDVRGHPRPGARPGGRGLPVGAAHRPPGRPLRPGRILPPHPGRGDRAPGQTDAQGPHRPDLPGRREDPDRRGALPEDWPVHGTTGYDFAALVDGLLVDRRGAGTLTRCYEAFIGASPSIADEAYARESW
jgi:(1->4)-alpha-D-glucan 1-alpha-D-glucosylmutase